jgi:hypothetical protein
MEHMYKEMLRNLLKKKYQQIRKTKSSSPYDKGKAELLTELYEYLGLGDINDKSLTADEIMISLYKQAH